MDSIALVTLLWLVRGSIAEESTKDANANTCEVALATDPKFGLLTGRGLGWVDLIFYRQQEQSNKLMELKGVCVGYWKEIEAQQKAWDLEDHNNQHDRKEY